MLTAASCFSGIGGAELALPEARWLWSAEVDPFANAVRQHHLNAANLGDVLADDFLQRATSCGPLDVLIGGPPCQDFSVAGLRKGLDGACGNLTLRWVQIIHATRPRYAVTENVPGWLSVNGGHAFGAFLAGLVGHDTALLPPKQAGGRWTNAGMVAGPDGRAAWRILDAQYFALAQRRQRVFVVFCPRDGDDPAAVLFEPSCLRGHPPPRREAGERAANALTERADRGGGLGTDFDCDGGLIASALRGNAWCDHAGDESRLIAMCLNAHGGSGRIDAESETFVTHSLRAAGFDASEDGTGRGTPLVAQRSSVRRLMPIEAERLQGFPDGWTNIPYRGKPAADGPRYRALGNAFAVPVVRWIARRIAREHADMQPALAEAAD